MTSTGNFQRGTSLDLGIEQHHAKRYRHGSRESLAGNVKPIGNLLQVLSLNKIGLRNCWNIHCKIFVTPVSIYNPPDSDPHATRKRRTQRLHLTEYDAKTLVRKVVVNPRTQFQLLKKTIPRQRIMSHPLCCVRGLIIKTKTRRRRTGIFR